MTLISTLNRMIIVGLFCSIAACHFIEQQDIVRVDVFEDHVSVDGILYDLQLQQVADTQTRTRIRKTYVLFIPQDPLSAMRYEEIDRVYAVK